MATITFEFTVSAENKTRIIDGLSYQHGYQDQVEVDGEMVDNPESKGAFCKRMLKQWLRENVKAFEVSEDVKVARDANWTLDEFPADNSIPCFMSTCFRFN